MKNRKRYRYYTSQTVIQGTGARPDITRLPAEEIEALVIREIGRLLRTFKKHVPDFAVTLDADSAMERARSMASQWSKIERSKQDEFLRRILTGVILGQDHVWIEIDRVRLVSALLGKPFADLGLTNPRTDTVKIAVPFRFSRKGAELRIDTPSCPKSQTTPAPSLVKALAQAHDWYEQLTNGKVSTMEEIAARAGCSSSYVKRILQCALLSPTITEAILAGGQRSGFNLENLRTSIPSDWQHQEKMYEGLLGGEGGTPLSFL